MMRRAARLWLSGLGTLCVLAAVLSVLAFARGRARADELVMDLGAQLLAYAKATELDTSRTLIVNGLSLHVLSGSTPDGVSALLDTFHARCRRASGGLDRRPPELPGTHRWPRIAEHAFDPVLRRDDARGGYVACLDLRTGSVSADDLLARLQRFLEHADPSEVGDLRFAWAFRSGDTTTYVGVYTDGPLPLAAAFPARGDAPGSDVSGVPRPEHARRVLSAFQRDAAPMLASYESSAGPRVALQSFAGQLRHRGLDPVIPDHADGALYASTSHGDVDLLAFASALGAHATRSPSAR
jgi:hypothetical protein